MKAKNIRCTALLVAVLIFFPVTIFADDLQNAVQSQDYSAIEELLMSAEDSAPLERRIIQYAREAIRKKDLASARELVSTVLLVNFENKEAEELYLSIEEAQRQQELQAQQALQQQAVEEAQQKEVEKEEYLASLRVIGPENFSLNAQLTPLHYGIYRGLEPNEPGMLGSSAAAAFRFQHPVFSAGLSAAYKYSYLSLSDFITANEFRFDIWLGAPLWIGSALNPEKPLFKLPLHLRVSYHVLNNTSIQDPPPDNFPYLEYVVSPGIGIAIDQLQITDRISISAGYDWLPLNLGEATIMNSFAADISSDITIMSITPKIELYAQPRVHTYHLMLTDHNEWNTTISAAVGARFYAKK